jgi:hypothetical protein
MHDEPDFRAVLDLLRTSVRTAGVAYQLRRPRGLVTPLIVPVLRRKVGSADVAGVLAEYQVGAL